MISYDYYKRVYAYITNELPPPQIVHANDLDALFVAYRVARKYNTPLIYDAQEYYPGLHTLPRWYRRILEFQEFVLIRKADKVIIVNDAIADLVERKYKIHVDAVILNCPPYEESPQRGNINVRQRLGISEDTPIFLYSGALVRHRGIENTVRALKYLEKGVLVILGEGPLKEALVSLIERENLTNRVYFSDFVPHTEVPSFISSTQVGIVPYENVGLNHYLCSPSKLFHYIMAELPIACSDFPFLRKVVLGHEIGAVFNPSDPVSIAQAITYIIEDEERYQAIKRNIKQAKKRFNWDVEGRKFLEIYASVHPPSPASQPTSSEYAVLPVSQNRAGEPYV